jgi:hypothetical protein
MGKNTDLVAIEKRSWSSMFQDGLWEIIIGLTAFSMALGLTLDELGTSDIIRIAITYPILFSGAPILYLGKRYLTTPRIGIAKFARRRESRMLVMFGIMLAALLTTLGIWMGISYFQIDSSWFGSLTISILIFALFCSIAYYFDVNRFYLIAGFMAIGEPAVTLLRSYTDLTYVGIIAWGIPALLILGMGFIVMGLFLKKYPHPLIEKDEVASNAA